MKCPACTDTNLLMAERHGVEIDYCPNCRGVWLDRGELDKIIDRAAEGEGPASTGTPPPQPPVRGSAPPSPHPPTPQTHPGYAQQPMPHYDPNDSSHYGYRYQPPYKKRKSFLRELFDF